MINYQLNIIIFVKTLFLFLFINLHLLKKKKVISLYFLIFFNYKYYIIYFIYLFLFFIFFFVLFLPSSNSTKVFPVIMVNNGIIKRVVTNFITSYDIIVHTPLVSWLWLRFHTNYLRNLFNDIL